MTVAQFADAGKMSEAEYRTRREAIRTIGRASGPALPCVPMEARRLDVLQVALTTGVRAGQPGAVLAAVRIMERRARLFGLDAPTKIAGPEGDAVPIRIVHREVRA